MSKTSCAVFGGGAPDKFALGAAIGVPENFISDNATSLAGNLIPTLDRPPVTKSGTILFFGNIIVKAPGQNAANNFSAAAEIFATRSTISRFATCKLSGLSDGLPFAEKIFPQASTLKPSAPNP